VTSQQRAGWTGLALAVIAAFIAVPPALVRSSAPSIVLAILAIVGAVAATKSGESNLRDVFTWSALIASMLRFATPLLFAALGGIMSERSGVVNIGLEGMMLMGAFFGIYGSDLLGSWVGGLVVAIVAGGLLAFVHAAFSISLRADQIVSGTAVNFLALGITGYVFIAHYGDTGTPDNISRVPDLHLGFLGGDSFFGNIALAAVIFGKWKPAGALVATLLFGFSSALANRLPTFSASTAVLFQALPYVLTLIAVAGVIGRSRPPAADGIPYVKEG
jgi:ABC-type uncharacterized transport system permease subunit